MRDSPRGGGTGIKRGPPEQCQHIFHIRPVLFTNYYSYYPFTPGSIRFRCRDPSVRLSPKLFWVARAESSASGSFAIKSEWTPATVSFQCRNFISRSRGTSARRASKTPSAFFQDICDVRRQQCWSCRYRMAHTPRSKSRRVYSSMYIS